MKKRTLFAIGVAGAVVLRGLGRVVDICRERDDLRAQLAEAQARYEQVPDEVRRRIERDTNEKYQLPRDGARMTITTLIGEVRLVAPTGYYTGTAIFVYLPTDYTFDDGFRAAFNKATDGKFHLDPARRAGVSGDPSASGVITAGLDWHAHAAGHQGYFKESPAPRMEEMAALLSRLIEVHCEDGVVASK